MIWISRAKGMMGKLNGLDRSPLHLLHRASQCVDDLFWRAVKSDLTPRQLALLTTIANNKGCNQSQLVALTGIDRSTTAEMMKRLLKKGLVSRRRSEADTRADEGQNVVKKAAPLARSVDNKVSHALGSGGAAFLEKLSLLVNALSASAGQASGTRRQR